MKQKYSLVNLSIIRCLLQVSLVIVSFMASTTFAKSILVMGDSLSAAYQLPIEQGWVALLENQLSEQDSSIIFTNASISGETTQGGRSRLPKLLEQKQPDVVILELGANDALRGYPLNQTKDNLAYMIEQSQQAGADILLIGNQIPPNYGRRYSEAFFKLYQELADQYDILLVPFMLENVALDSSLMQNDGLHPNAAGQIKVLDNIKPAVTKLITNQ